MIKILIGGSPCTFWSIAQKNNRETEAEGLGWELFKNYLIAKEKFKPDFFLYENNKSAAQPIKDQISRELGVDLMYINSALVSAQNRQRFYAFNWEVEQPEDRGILLKDILESGEDLSSKEKSYCLLARYDGATPKHTLEKSLCTMVAESVRIPEYGAEDKARPLNAHYSNNCGGFEHRMFSENPNKQQVDMIATPIRVGCMPSPDGTIKNSQGMRVYDVDGKSVNLTAQGGGLGAKTGLYAIPCENVGESETVQKAIPKLVDKYGYVPEQFNAYNVAEITDKSPTLSTGSMVSSSCATTRFEEVDAPTMRVKEATKQGYVDIEVGDCVDLTMPNSKTRRGRSMKDKCNCLTKQNEFYQYCGTVEQNIGECAMFSPPHGWNEGLITYDKSQTITTGSSARQQNVLIQDATSGASVIEGEKPRSFINKVYEVSDGFITIKGKEYPIKLKDGYYIIRKLTPIECERLQTLPDNYTASVSNAQRYKGLGNGWTAEVIIHILNGALKDVPRDEEIVVLSMYDGIGTGRYCLDKMGFTNVKYYAYEIDKYAKQVAMSNYPDIIQMGDAFDLRHPDWTIGY